MMNNVRIAKRIFTAIMASMMIISSLPANVYADEKETLESEDKISVNETVAVESEDKTSVSETDAVESEDKTSVSETDAVESLEEIFDEEASSSSEDVKENSTIPRIDYRYINTDFRAPIVNDSDMLSLESELPSYYDARTNGYVTAVKNQGSYGICWAYGTLASLESNIIKNGIEDNPDLSEMHLAFYSFNYKDLNDKKHNTLGDYAEMMTPESYLYDGANIMCACNALVNWVGAASEEEYPYSERLEESKSESDCFNDIVHVQNYKYYSKQQPELIKNAIKEYGSIAANYYHGDEPEYYNDSNSAYYCDESDKGANHCINIIGWDDNYPASRFNIKPSRNGAWIVKNSWGTDYFDDGFMWLSYEDATIEEFTAILGEPANNYDNNYFYDGGIWNEYICVPIGSEQTTEYANVYTTEGNEETLKAVSFAVGSSNVEYSIQAYLDPEVGNPSSGTPLFKQPITGTTDAAGYYSIPINEEVIIPENISFSIVISVAKWDKIGVDRSTTLTNWINFVTEEKPNQSFYGSDTLNEWHDGIDNGLTFRIHAFTNNEPEEEPSQEQNDLSSARVTLGKTTGIYTGKEIQPPVSSVVLYNNDGTPVVLVKDRDYQVGYENNIDVANDQSDNPPAVVIKGINEYKGEAKALFEITPMRIGSTTINYDQNGYTYTGDEIEIEPVYTNPNTDEILEDGVDYQLYYKNNIDVANASNTYAPTVIAKGIGNYCDTKTIKFSIITCPIDSKDISVTFKDGDTYKYTGYAIEPELIIMNGSNLLEKNKDYKVNYSHNRTINDAMPRAEITGIGNYKGTRTAYFSIISGEISELTVSLDKDSYEYTGSAIKPRVTVKNQNGEVVNGYHYNLTYSSNINAADKDSSNAPTVTVVARNGQGYEGSISKTFSITPRDISSAVLTLDNKEYYYTGSEIKPSTTVTINGKSEPLEAGADYKVVYTNNIEPCLSTSTNPPTVTIEGIGNNKGTLSKTFDIKSALKKNVNAYVDFDKGDKYIWTGSEIRPEFELTYNNGKDTQTLTKNVDYTVAYSNNINISANTEKAHAVITGKGLYSGTFTVDYSIVQRNLTGTDWNDAEISINKSSFYYTGTERKPVVTVKFNGSTLKAGKDYSVEYLNCVDAGKVGDMNAPKAVITGIGNYTGSVEKEYEIIGKNIAQTQAILEYTSIDKINYDDLTEGKIVPNVTVIDRGNSLYASKQYILDDKCYSIEIPDDGNKSLGRVTLIIKGTGNYSGEKKLYYTIKGTEISRVRFAPLSKVTASVDKNGNVESVTPDVIAISGYGYITPEKSGENGYEVYYLKNDAVGTGRILVAGRGTYSGSKGLSFTISAKPISSNDINVDLNESELTYSGKAQTLSDIEITDTHSGYVLQEGRDYRLWYINNIRPGKMKVFIQGKGVYTGIREEAINIVKAPIDNSKVEIVVNDAVYANGREVKPAVYAYYTFDGGDRVKLSSYDYSVVYSNNINVSTNDSPATVTIVGTGRTNFDTGRCDTGKFMIKDRAHMLSASTVSVAALPNVIFSGSEIKAQPVVTNRSSKQVLEALNEDRSNENTADYYVEYANNVNCGYAKVYIKGMNDYAGQVQSSFRILSKKLNSSSSDSYDVKVNGGEAVYYTGYTCMPRLTIEDKTTGGGYNRTLVEGTDYTVRYLNAINASSDKAFAVVYGKGNYSGSMKVPFTIQPIDFDDEHIFVKSYPMDYTGRALRPDYEVYYSEKGSDDVESSFLLRKGIAYNLSYGNNVNVSDNASITITRTGKNTNVTDSSVTYVSKAFSIKPGDLSGAYVGAIGDQAYRNGQPVTPVLFVRVNGTILKLGRDYSVSYSDNTRRGLASATITAATSSTNYEGSKTVYFYIR